MEQENCKKAQCDTEEYVWRCTVCGRIYEGDPVPKDYQCPTCKAPAPKFERITRMEAESKQFMKSRSLNYMIYLPEED